MNYKDYEQKHRLGKLPYPYKWYITFLHKKFWDWMSYSQFANYYQQLWYTFIKRKKEYENHKKLFKKFWDYNRYIIWLNDE